MLLILLLDNDCCIWLVLKEFKKLIFECYKFFTHSILESAVAHMTAAYELTNKKAMAFIDHGF